MSTFKIVYPDIRITDIGTPLGSNQDAILFDSKSEILESTSTGTTFDIEYDFGEAVTVDYIYLGRADLLARRTDDDITVTVYADDNSSFTSPESDNFTYGYSDLKGYDSNDIIESLSFTTTYRYYRIRFTSVDTITFGISKVWIGEALDLGCNPDKPAQINIESQSLFQRLPIREIELKFSGVTNTIRENVYTKITKNQKISNYVLWDSNSDLFTNSHTAYYVELIETSYKPYGWALHDVEFIFKDEI